MPPPLVVDPVELTIDRTALALQSLRRLTAVISSDSVRRVTPNSKTR